MLVCLRVKHLVDPETVFQSDKKLIAYLGLDNTSIHRDIATTPETQALLEGWAASRRIGFGVPNKSDRTTYSVNLIFGVLHDPGDDCLEYNKFPLPLGAKVPMEYRPLCCNMGNNITSIVSAEGS